MSKPSSEGMQSLGAMMDALTPPLPQGCICWSDPVQALCDQHAETAESTGPIIRILHRTPQ